MILVQLVFHSLREWNEFESSELLDSVVMVYFGHRRKSWYFFQTRF